MNEAQQNSRPVLTVEVWSDIMCPFCYLGHSLLQQAITDSPYADRISVRHRSFLLMPDLPADHPTDLESLMRERGVPIEQMQAGRRELATRGAEAGIAYDFENVVTINTRSAHRIIHYAAAHGAGDAMVEALFRAHFSEGRDVADAAVLAELAGGVGLSEIDVRAVVEGTDYDDEVTEDISRARSLGVQGVPYFLFDGRLALSGAQPKAAFERALASAWQTIDDAVVPS